LPKLGIPTIRSALPTRRTSASPFSSSAEAGGAAGLDVRAGLLRLVARAESNVLGSGGKG
jgi:hypothetical protein